MGDGLFIMAALRHDRWRENLYGRTEEAQHLRGFWRTGLHHPGCQDCRVDRHLRWLRPVVTWHRFSWSQAVFSVSRPCRPDHPAQACSLGALAPGLQHRSQAQEIRPSNRSSIEVVRLAGYAHLKPELDRLWTRLSRPFCSRLQLHSFARDWLCKGTHGSVHALRPCAVCPAPRLPAQDSQLRPAAAPALPAYCWAWEVKLVSLCYALCLEPTAIHEVWPEPRAGTLLACLKATMMPWSISWQMPRSGSAVVHC